MAQTKSKLPGREPMSAPPGKTKVCIFGASGVGKTWFALTFPKPFYIDTEGGADLGRYQKRLKEAGGWYMGVEDGSLNFETVLQTMKTLATESHPYKTLVIDSITKIFQTTIADASEKLGEADGYGASKKPAVGAMRRMFSWASKLDMNIIYLAHETTKWGKNPNTGKREEIGLVEDAWDKLRYELHLTLSVQKRGNSRYGVVEKTRLEGFPDKDQFELTYEEYAKRYGKDFIEAACVSVTLATDEQISEINRLLGVIKVDEVELDKILKQGNATKVEELTTEQATKFITWLNKKTEKTDK